MQTWQRRARRNIENNEKFVSLDMELIEFGFGIFHNSPPRRRNQIAVCCTMIEGKRDVKARHKIDSKKSLKRGIRNHFLMFRGIGFLVKLNFSTDRFISIQKIIHKPIKNLSLQLSRWWKGKQRFEGTNSIMFRSSKCGDRITFNF